MLPTSQGRSSSNDNSGNKGYSSGNNPNNPGGNSNRVIGLGTTRKRRRSNISPT